jgi:DNA polymerase
VKLPDTGAYVYAMDPTTDIWCAAYAFDDEEPALWFPPYVCDILGLQSEHSDDCALGLGGECDCAADPRSFLPRAVHNHIRDGGEIRAHNAAFERLMMRHVAVPRYHWPLPKDEQYVCSAAEAAAMSLPRSLGQLAQVTGVQAQKDDEGYQLMMRMCRPRKILDDGSLVWWDVPDRILRLAEYCKQDVRTEAAVEKVLRRLVPRERDIYLHTELKNDRGIHLDRALVDASKAISEEGIRRVNAELAKITHGAITEVTQTGQMRAWLGEQGVENHSVAKPAVRDLLAGELPVDVRRLLELRAEAGRSSVAKLDTMLECLCPDGRLRGLTLYHGATTGRESGRLVQPQNFPRGEINDVERFIPDILAGRYDAIDLVENPVSVVSSLLRGCLTASPGHELTAADFSAIEARVLVVLAGQQDVVANWRAFDAGDKSKDQYILNAMVLYNLPFEEIKKFPHRQTGKFQELGCGYGMGAKKAVSAAKDVYGLELDEDRAKEIVGMYRETHRKVVEFWHETDQAAQEAVLNPGKPITFGALMNLRFLKAGAYLYLILPSRRPLVYPAPKIVDRPTPWGEVRPAIEISTVDGKTKRWVRQSMYGGLWVENIVQAVSRDLLKEADLRVEAHGYQVILDVHDEIVAEAPIGHGSVKEFESLLAATPPWAEGWPIKAEGWRGLRYRK